MFVFGMDLPLMEILFVAIILIIIALIFIWIELIRFRKLLKLESLDINELESIQKEESRKRSVENYIKEQLEKGASREKIEEMLKKHGWTEDKIDSAFPKAE